MLKDPPQFAASGSPGSAPFSVLVAVLPLTTGSFATAMAWPFSRSRPLKTSRRCGRLSGPLPSFDDVPNQ